VSFPDYCYTPATDEFRWVL